MAVEEAVAKVLAPETEREEREPAPAVRASAPILMEPKLEVMLPESRAPTVVKEEVSTPVPRVLLVRTFVPFI